MAARRYEIFLRVKYFFQQQKKNFLSPSGHVMFYLLYKHQQTTNGIPNHFTLIVLWCERRDLLCSHSKGDIFICEDNLLFSHVKISSFRAKAHLLFYWCLYNKTKSATMLEISRTLITMGLFTWRWGTAGRCGNPPVHITSHFNVITFTCQVG